MKILTVSSHFKAHTLVVNSPALPLSLTHSLTHSFYSFLLLLVTRTHKSSSLPPPIPSPFHPSFLPSDHSHPTTLLPLTTELPVSVAPRRYPATSATAATVSRPRQQSIIIPFPQNRRKIERNNLQPIRPDDANLQMASAHHRRSAPDHFNLLLDAVNQSVDHPLASPTLPLGGQKVRRLDIQHLLAVSKQVDPDDPAHHTKVFLFRLSLTICSPLIPLPLGQRKAEAGQFRPDRTTRPPRQNPQKRPGTPPRQLLRVLRNDHHCMLPCDRRPKILRKRKKVSPSLPLTSTVLIYPTSPSILGSSVRLPSFVFMVPPSPPSASSPSLLPSFPTLACPCRRPRQTLVPTMLHVSSTCTSIALAERNTSSSNSPSATPTPIQTQMLGHASGAIRSQSSPNPPRRPQGHAQRTMASSTIPTLHSSIESIPRPFVQSTSQRKTASWPPLVARGHPSPWTSFFPGRRTTLSLAQSPTARVSSSAQALSKPRRCASVKWRREGAQRMTTLSSARCKKSR